LTLLETINRYCFAHPVNVSIGNTLVQKLILGDCNGNNCTAV
jgi:hypothetical protein